MHTNENIEKLGAEVSDLRSLWDNNRDDVQHFLTLSPQNEDIESLQIRVERTLELLDDYLDSKQKLYHRWVEEWDDLVNRIETAVKTKTDQFEDAEEALAQQLLAMLDTDAIKELFDTIAATHTDYEEWNTLLAQVRAGQHVEVSFVEPTHTNVVTTSDYDLGELLSEYEQSLDAISSVLIGGASITSMAEMHRAMIAEVHEHLNQAV